MGDKCDRLAVQSWDVQYAVGWLALFRDHCQDHTHLQIDAGKCKVVRPHWMFKIDNSR